MRLGEKVWRAIDRDPLVTTKAEEMGSLPSVQYHIIMLLSPYSNAIHILS